MLRLAALFALLCACAPVMRGARLRDDEPAFDREASARARERDCGQETVFWPGAPQLCRGERATGTAMAALGAAELGAGIAAGVQNGFGSNSAGLPLLAFGDLLTLSAMDAVLERQRAAALRFVPQEDLGELWRAPFSGEVLERPMVWGGILGTLAAGLLVSRIVDGPMTTNGFGQRPVLFGHETNSALGYPVALGLGVGLFEHVALAEEMAFRGVLQSGWARTQGETRGWIYGSLAFGLIHSTNIFFMDASQRPTYLAVGVPFITVLGSYLGLTYRESGYSLAPSIAVHFWYDFLVEAIGFLGDPKNSPLAVTYAIPF